MSDGTEELCRILYGRPAKATDWLGGSKAQMLHDAVTEIVRLREQVNFKRSSCRYCYDIRQWVGDAPIPHPLALGDRGMIEMHCGYDGAPAERRIEHFMKELQPRFAFRCPICG